MPDPDDRPGRLALSILSAATIAELKADSDELSKLYATLSESQRERFRVLFSDPDIVGRL
ncbi:hypothetical protein ABIF86_005627 [Bradyrhizobium japonicum]